MIRKKIIALICCLVTISVLLSIVFSLFRKNDVYIYTINQSKTIDGLEIIVDYAVGDRYNLFLSVTAHIPDNLPIDAVFKGMTINICDGGVYNYWHMIDNNPNDRTIHYLVRYNSPTSIIGRKVELVIYDYLTYDDVLNPIIRDKWVFSFKIDNDYLAQQFAIQKTIDDVYFDKVAITPMMIAFSTNNQRPYATHIEVAVELNDGTLCQLQAAHSGLKDGKILYFYLDNINHTTISKIIINGKNQINLS